MITYAASGLIINALLDAGPYQVGWLYCRYGNNQGSPPSGTLVLPTGGIQAVTRANFLAATAADQGALWVPVLGAPVITSSNTALYSGNVATYSFRIPYNIAAAQMSPVGTFNPATSYIMALALAVAQNAADRTQDLFIAVDNSYTPTQVPSGGQLGIDYPLTVATST